MKTRHRSLRLRILLVSTLCLSSFGWAQEAGATKPAPETRPNIIFVHVDDLGWQDTEVPFHSEVTPFNRRYRTPNMDRLAQRGMVFTQAHAAAPVCTPSRVSLMTGQAPIRHGVTYWILHKDRDTSRKHPTLAPPTWKLNGLQPGAGTLAERLKGGGYTTIHCGKWHMGAKGTPGENPLNCGFDVNIAGHGAGAPGSYLSKDEFGAKRKRGARHWDVPGLDSWYEKDVYLTDVLAVEASTAMKTAAAKSNPWFLHFAPYAVHTPIMANKRLLDAYDGLHPKEAAYATMVESVDDALGLLLATCEELGVMDRTYVFLTSDNGGLSAGGRGGKRHVHNLPLKSGKGSAYEGGTRVIALAAGPKVQAAKRCDIPITTSDWCPTILNLAGVGLPDALEHPMDGRDVLPLLQGREWNAPSWLSRPLIWHQPHTWGSKGPGIQPFSSIRQGPWKLIWYHAERRVELFNLTEDLGEMNDLSTSQPARAKALAQTLQVAMERAGALPSLVKPAEAEADEESKPVAWPSTWLP